MWSLVWPLLRSWLLRRGLSLLGWLAAAAAVLALLLGARRAGRNDQRIELFRQHAEIRDRQMKAYLRRPLSINALKILMRTRTF